MTPPPDKTCSMQKENVLNQTEDDPSKNRRSAKQNILLLILYT